MKKYILSIFAVVLAVGMVAFTAPERNTPAEDMYVFEFRNSQPYTLEKVENISNANWEFMGKNLELCDDINDKACRVAVSKAFVDDEFNPTALKDVTISATLSGTNAHVTSISGTGNQYSNKPN